MGEWDIWFLLAGRGYGKTRAAAEWLVSQALSDPGSYAVIGQNSKDLRAVNFQHKESGLLDVAMRVVPGFTKKLFNVRDNFLRFPNGSIIYGYTGETPDGARGHSFKAIWYDELAAYAYPREVFENSQYACRKGEAKFVITTTPTRRSVKLLKEIKAAKGTIVTTGNSYDNIANLSKNWKDRLDAKLNTKKGREEIFAELIEDAGLLFQESFFQRASIDPSDLQRIVIAFDPAIRSSFQANESGVIACGKKRGAQGSNWDLGYVLEDASLKGSVDVVARKVVEKYHQYKADSIVVETNNGGDWIPALIKHVDPNVVIKQVVATKGKEIRATPIAELYEQKRIFHTGYFHALEDQLVEFNPEIPLGRADGSPDRMDALVWGFTELFPPISDFTPIVHHYSLGLY